MADQQRNREAGEPTQPGAGKKGRPAVDYARYRMNPVQIKESVEAARAVPRRIFATVVVLALLAVAVIGVIIWERLAAERSPLESLNPDVRDEARELVDNLLTRIESLQGYVYDAEYPTPTRLRIFISPTFGQPGEERAVTGKEIEDATLRVTDEFRGYGRKRAKLTVEAFVVEHPALAADQPPVAVGEYDPETEKVSVRLTTRIPVPARRSTGAAPPGHGHVSEHGGPGAPPG
jgi:hypothetical protein